MSHLTLQFTYTAFHPNRRRDLWTPQINNIQLAGDETEEVLEITFRRFRISNFFNGRLI